MTIDEIKGWRKLLWWSFIYATIAVVASTLVVGILSSMEKPGAEGHGLSGADIASCIRGFPSTPGWLIVKRIFGKWEVVHGGQLILIWPLSLAIDSILIFLIGEFLHRKASSDFASRDTLGLGG